MLFRSLNILILLPIDCHLKNKKAERTYENPSTRLMGSKTHNLEKVPQKGFQIIYNSFVSELDDLVIKNTRKLLNLSKSVHKSGNYHAKTHKVQKIKCFNEPSKRI